MAAYAEQVLICTGKEDWKSRIEDEEDAVLVNQLKKNLTRGGKFVDVRGRENMYWMCDLDQMTDEVVYVAISQHFDHKLLFPTFEFSRRA